MVDRYVVGISGASGAIYALRTIQWLVELGAEVHIASSSYGKRLFFDELDIKNFTSDNLVSSEFLDQVFVYSGNDKGASIASGSFLTKGMVIVPTSGNTLGAIASGLTENLVQRAAAVTLKERRKLVLAHRESPLSPIDIVNMNRLSQAGVIIAPLSPGFYHKPKTLDEVVDFMAAKILDLLGVSHTKAQRWEKNN